MKLQFRFSCLFLRAMTMDGIGTAGSSLHVPAAIADGDASSIGGASSTGAGGQRGEPEDARSKVMEMLGESR